MSLLTPKIDSAVPVFPDSSVKRRESTWNCRKTLKPSYHPFIANTSFYLLSVASLMSLIASHALVCQPPLLLCALLGPERTASLFSLLFFLFSVSVFPCPPFRSIAITKYRWTLNQVHATLSALSHSVAGLRPRKIPCYYSFGAPRWHVIHL